MPATWMAWAVLVFTCKTDRTGKARRRAMSTIRDAEQPLIEKLGAALLELSVAT